MVRESHSLPAQPWRQPRRQPSPVTDRDHRMSSHPRTRVYRSTRRFAANNRSERLREVRHLSAETRRSGKSVTPRSPVGTAKTPAHACDQFLRRPCRGGDLEHLCAALALLRWVTRRLYLGGWVPCLPIKQLHSGSGRLRSPDRSTVEGFAWLPEARRKFRVSVRRRCRSHVRQCSDSSADRDSLEVSPRRSSPSALSSFDDAGDGTPAAVVQPSRFLLTGSVPPQEQVSGEAGQTHRQAQ